MLQRHKETLVHYLMSITNSDVHKYMDEIILYGSCARGTEKYDSDLDLFVIFKENTNDDIAKKTLMYLRNDLPFWDEWDWREPELDIHAVIGNWWRDRVDLYYENIRKDGIIVWQSGTIILV